MTRDDLLDRLLDTSRRKRVMVTDWVRFRAEHLPRMTRVLVGRMSYTDLSHPEVPVRYVWMETWPYSPHELAGVYVREMVRASPARQAWASAKELRHLSIPHPLYWCGVRTEGNLAYLDLRRAYWSLWSTIASLDRPVLVRPDDVIVGRGRIPLTDAGMWRDTRLGRDAVVGIARATRFTEMHRGTLVRRTSPSRVTAPRLWLLMAMILHAVARDMVSLGALAVHTDGYILPAEQVDQARRLLRDDWALDSKIKGKGLGVVSGIGSYEIGGARSAHVRPDSGPPICNLLDVSPGQRNGLRRILLPTS